MQPKVTLLLESTPGTKQATAQLNVVLAAAGLALTLTTTQATQPVTPWRGKLTASIERPLSQAVTTIAHAPDQAKPKTSWLSSAAERIRDKIPAAAWDTIPNVSADDLDRNLYGT